MAFPFGGHPTLGQFVEWAIQNNCSAEIKVQHRPTGQAYQVLEIRKSNGGSVAVAEPDLEERLEPSMVTYLQRRLGIKTPFAAQPE
jgi:predicted PhzF superfamily epimerase YddE/YHI9